MLERTENRGLGLQAGGRWFETTFAHQVSTRTFRSPGSILAGALVFLAVLVSTW